MKHTKKLSLLLALALGVTPVLTSVNQTKSYAEEDNKVYDKIFVGNKYVYVKKGLNVPEETILDILNQSNSDALIKIENYTKNKEKRKYETRGKRTHVIRDHFTRYIYKNKKVIATVAKGGSYTLNRTINFNQSVSVSGSVEASILSVAKANISANYANEFSDSISVGSVYT
ncbi:hypothetical protein, partial [Prevotella sp. OH937_COT-195]|uniref:hypothetical protein n=1 Tax=Prevotella sp. OH937_COT-195 TaxID=2491051 RepID=UPI000FA83278